MSWPRLTVQGLMIAVVVVAVDIALLRPMLRDGLEVVALSTIPVLLLNIALCLWLRSAKPGQAFWAGYLVLGGLVLASWIGMIVEPGHTVPLHDGSGGTRFVPSLPHACWDSILITPLDWLEGLWRRAFGGVPRWLRSFVGYPYCLVLHVGPAVLGGLVAAWWARRAGNTSEG
jgi:hypothetical protein